MGGIIPMSTGRIVPDEARYVVTSEGHAAALAEASCKCSFANRDGWLICIYCATGFKTARPQAARTPEKRVS